MSKSDVAPSSLGVRKPAEVQIAEAVPELLRIRDALQRAHDGESPDAIMEELRAVDCE